MRILDDSNSLRYFQNLTNIHQMSIFRSLLMIVTLGLLFSSCGKPPKNSKFIPKDVSTVICLNLQKMTAKLVTIKDLLDEDTKKIQSSGLDFTQSAYIFAKWDPKNKKNNYVGATFMLTDESKFDSFLRKSPTKDKVDIKSSEGVKYAIIDKKAIIGWANRSVIVLAANHALPEKEWVTRLLKLRDQPDSESLAANNKYFAELEGQVYDAAAWLNWGNTIEQLKKNPTLKFYSNYLDFAGINFKENYITGLTTFEKGKSTTDIKWHMTKALSQYKGLFKNDIDNKLLQHIPAKEPMAMIGLGLHTKGFEDILNSFGLNKQISSWLKRYTGLNTSQLFDMLSGDMMASIIDIRKQEITEQTIDKEGNPESRTVTKINYKFLLGAEIHNMASLEKLLGKLSDNGNIEKNGDLYTFKMADNTNYLFVKDKMLFGTWTKAIKDAVMENKGVRLKSEYVDLGKNSAFSFFSDIKKENLRKIPSENLDLIPFGLGPSLKKMDSPIESFSIQTSPAQNNISITKVVINFTDKDKNSLRSLMEMARDMGKNVFSLPEILSGQ